MTGTAPADPTTWILVHELTRTGVPIVLARLLGALPAAARQRVHVVAGHGGPLATELTGLAASLTVLEPPGRRSLPGALHAALAARGRPGAGELVRRLAWRARLERLPRPDVVVVHGAGAWPIVAAVPGGAPVVLHLHELATGLDRSIPPSQQSTALRGAARVLAVSGPVADLAVARGARPEQLAIVPGVVAATAPLGTALAAADVGAGDVGAADDAATAGSAVARPRIMGAGTPGWRKGTDRLAAFAYGLGASGHEADVAWVGGAPAPGEAQTLGRPDPVDWLAESPDPWALLATAAAIVVPSREDPLPLVALEAGAHGRAVVAMPTGGLPALLGHGRGLVAPTQDVRWCVDALRTLLDSPAYGRELGGSLRDHVLAHHTPGAVAPVWWELVVDAAGAHP